ncbi:competence type IV pilus minor pilin ComGG [Peribacillus sp. FSL H8-0477]|uniref:competence type IV pilus minor pilin ComGG n=1 Tax=Peribacillus sp. FSL H8-0477 TaxID=2921388 RepID=UPI0030F938D6
MDNEKGYSLPMIMILSASLCMIAIFTSDRFIGEKHFYKAVEERLIADHLMRLALIDLEIGLKTDQILVEESGSFKYPNGTVNYKVKTRSEDTITIDLSAVTKNNHHKEAVVYYHTDLHKMIEWVEK